MSEFNDDIEKLAKKYPFLDNIWNLYKEFYAPVDGDSKMQTYEDLCVDILAESPGIQRKYKDFCKKLIRNLYSPSNYRKNGNLNSEHCKNLYNWLYYMIIKYGVPDDLISKCFQKTESKMKEQGKHTCPYSSYKEIHEEPEAMLKINNFEGIMDVVKTKLMDNDHSENCSCEEYVYDCVRMYNYMNDKYCDTFDKKEKIYKDTCFQLSAFYKIYNSYYSQNTQLNGKIPPISKADTHYHFKCSTGESNILSGDAQDNRTEGSILLSVPSVLGTVAGISSIFALSYKFTPIGKRLHPRYLRKIGIINNLDEESNELILQRLENANINSSPSRYNVSYGPV